MRYSVVALLAFSACGPVAQNVSKTLPGGSDSPELIAVSLNDAFTTVAPNGSEKVQTSDTRLFTPPNAVNVVLGEYQGSNPGQYLHAKIVVGDAICEYQANGIHLTALNLQYCTGGVTHGVYIPSGTVIELVNYDAPGFLLQADFSLVK